MSQARSTVPAERPRFRCRIGLHRWVQVKHEDTDLENPGGNAEWRTVCRDCGAQRRSGFLSTVVLAGAVAVGGILVWWLVSPVLGALMVSGAVLGLGWAAAITGLGRLGSFGFRYRG